LQTAVGRSALFPLPRDGSTEVPLVSRPATAARILSLVASTLLAACAVTEQPAGPSPAETFALVDRLMPPRTPDRAVWATDIQASFAALGLAPTADNFCAVIAVTEQESTFQAQPTVPGLSKIAWKEIEDRASRMRIPTVVVRSALERVASPDGRSYAARIDAVRTERELSDVFDDMIGLVPLGKTLFGRWNPVRTGGPMQVSIAFAEAHASRHDYPWQIERDVRSEVFSRRGGMYFGIAHLLHYPANYDRQLYRFADFNAGHHASRNAAFQHALALATGTKLALDGDLIDHSAPASSPGNTERAARTLAGRLGVDDAAIRRALEQGDTLEFERTALYQGVFRLAEARAGEALPRARVPDIRLQSPKITRNLTTAWFADRVEQRYRRCLERAPESRSAPAADPR
jgi:hypothetical protein